jgi:hypothetical protein
VRQPEPEGRSWARSSSRKRWYARCCTSSIRISPGWNSSQSSAGNPADYSPITDPGSADALVAFLSALHSTAPADAPDNPVRGGPLATLQHGFDDWFPLIASLPYAGDPATDLAAAWVLLPAETASRFFGAYAKTDSATFQRARGWAVLRALILIGIGRNGRLGLPGGQAQLGTSGRAALERVLAAS